jgi:hypothetical protein
LSLGQSSQTLAEYDRAVKRVPPRYLRNGTANSRKIPLKTSKVRTSADPASSIQKTPQPAATSLLSVHGAKVVGRIAEYVVRLSGMAGYSINDAKMADAHLVHPSAG